LDTIAANVIKNRYETPDKLKAFNSMNRAGGKL
jgi:hypothetical protein